MRSYAISRHPIAARAGVLHPLRSRYEGRTSRLASHRIFFAGILLAIAVLCPISARAQGCVQCRDNTAATSPATQRAYRHAIEMMIVAAGGIFVVTLFLLKRNAPNK